MERYGGGGVTAEVLLESGWDGTDVAVLRTSFAPGSVVPLHAHPEPEAHRVIEGRLELYRSGAWTDMHGEQGIEIAAGDGHAIRNAATTQAVMLTLLPGSLLAFIRETAPRLDGTSAASRTAAGAVASLAERRSHGYVNASRADNAAIGITLPELP